MSAVCPACGVAIVPGYVRCPKCHAALPYGAGRRGAPTSIGSGGTAVKETRFPLGAVIAAVVVVLVIVMFFGLRGGSDDEPEPDVVPEQPAGATVPVPAQRPAQPSAIEAIPPAQPATNPSSAVADLERALRQQRLWSTVEVDGARIDVRSAACGDAELTRLIDGAAASLRGVGLTRLRCLAQSGAVVLERDL